MKTTAKNAFTGFLTAITVTLVAACTSIPTQLQGEYAEVSPADVQPDVFGSSVRWGGVLVDTRNEKDRTCFEVLSRELDRSMRPRPEDRTAGRFIACTSGFHDPEIYANGREVTITGQIKNVETRKIEEFDYRYPVLEITDLVLWEERDDVIVYDGFYDPFYYSYFWWGYPYWGYYPYYRYPGPYYRGAVHMSTRHASRGNSAASTRDR